MKHQRVDWSERTSDPRRANHNLPFSSVRPNKAKTRSRCNPKLSRLVIKRNTSDPNKKQVRGHGNNQLMAAGGASPRANCPPRRRQSTLIKRPFPLFFRTLLFLSAVGTSLCCFFASTKKNAGEIKKTRGNKAKLGATAVRVDPAD